MKEKLELDLKFLNDNFKELRKDKSNKFISFSMLTTIDTCLRLYRFSYIDKPDVERDNVYTYLGTLSHSLIEQLYRDEISKEEAINILKNKVNTMKYYFIDYTFVENVEKRKEMEDKNNLYEKNYTDNLIKYFKNFKKSNYIGFLQEKHISLELKKLFNKLPFTEYVFNGIVDFIGINEDGSLDIIDYKTSTVYKGEKLKLHSFQLILYALCLEKLGYKINKISWNFIKYNIAVKTLKNGNTKYYVKERRSTEEDKYDNVKDYLLDVEYNEATKRETLRFLYDNIIKIYKLKVFDKLNINKLPNSYNPFFCENLCPYYKLCELR